MRVLLVFSFLLVISVQTFAQFNTDQALYIRKIEKYRKMRNAGTFLTVAGGILVVVGVSTMVKATTTTVNNGYSSQTSTTGNFDAGLLEYLGGVACLGSGIPLWIVGAHQTRKYTRKLEGVYVGFDMAPQKAGLRLSYRF